MDRDMTAIENRTFELRNLLTASELDALAIAAELYWREQAIIYSPR